MKAERTSPSPSASLVGPPFMSTSSSGAAFFLPFAAAVAFGLGAALALGAALGLAAA